MADPVFEPWLAEPRDPLVMRDGGLPAFAFAPARPAGLPPQGTLAGMVRTVLGRRSGGDWEVEAPRLIGVPIQGPWLVQRATGKESIWVPAPSDALFAARVKAGDPPDHFVRLRPAQANGGVHWPDGATLRCLTLPPGAEPKLLALPGQGSSPACWPLELAVRWATCHGEAVEPDKTQPFKIESRVHVSIDSSRQTAEPGLLFSSSGARFHADFAIGFAVGGHRAPEHAPARLGGEGRTVILRPGSRQSAFPAYDASDYSSALDALVSRGDRVGLRLQLLTPACLCVTDPAGIPWLPPWLSMAGGTYPDSRLRLKLEALAMPQRAGVVSGWSLKQGGARRIRRLVPAGTVYYFSVETSAKKDLLAWCEHVWGRTIDNGSTSGDPGNFLARPADDGYGLVLPGFWLDGESQQAAR